MIDIEAIRERAERATPGPWHFVPENAGLMMDHGYGLLYGEADSWGWEKNLYISVGCSGNVRHDLGEGAGEANAAFIAHAREDIPGLLSHISALTALLGEAREALRPFAELFVADEERVIPRHERTTDYSFVKVMLADIDRARAVAAGIDGEVK